MSVYEINNPGYVTPAPTSVAGEGYTSIGCAADDRSNRVRRGVVLSSYDTTSWQAAVPAAVAG